MPNFITLGCFRPNIGRKVKKAESKKRNNTGKSCHYNMPARPKGSTLRTKVIMLLISEIIQPWQHLDVLDSNQLVVLFPAPSPSEPVVQWEPS
jgi:hypothetical protein